jgi:nicotinamidase-related amidase
MSTHAIAVIDMQKAYFQAGDLQGKEPVLVTAANQLLSAARDNGVPIFNIKTLHERDRSTWTLNMLDDEQGYLFSDEEGSETLEGLLLEGATPIVKTRDSAFFGTTLAEQLRAASVDTVILLGVSTHSCMYQTASDAYAHNFRVLIAEEAVDSHDRRWHDPALEMLAQEYRHSLLTTSEICALLTEIKTIESKS